MNQLALSTDLTVITAEINSFKQVAGQAVFEIGKRLKHVKENDLAKGGFKEWAKNNCDFDYSTASRFIQAFDQFGNATSQLSTGKIFEMLSLPESVDRADFIEKEHIIPSTGELKTVDKMTVKEAREVTKAVKEAEKRAAQAELAYQKALTEHTQQQEILLAQIAELKLVKDSPETLKRIAELEEKADREHQLAMDNIKLQLDMKNMERDFAEKITRRDKETQAYADLRKSLRSIINIVTMEHSNARQQYKLIEGHKEANEAVQDFIKRFDPLIQEVFQEWREAATLTAGEVIVNVGKTGAANSGIIEIAGGEG